MYQKTTLDNGLRILSEEIPHVRSVSIGLWINVGSRDETNDNSGISHFIEHMMFKGTNKRTAKDIAEELDAVGGQLNAFTTKEYTCYHSKVLDEHFDLAVDVLTDMVFNSKFAPEDIDREKNVIIEEIKMYEDAPDELVHDIFTNTIWHGHPLGRPIIGTTEIVSSFSRDDLLDFHHKHYTPEKMVISVAGNIKHEKVVEKLAPILSQLKATKTPRQSTPPQGVSNLVCRNKDTEQVHMVIGTPGYQLDHEDIYTVQLINTVLGGGLSSRLFQEIREQRGLVYTVFSYHSSYHDTGLFAVYAGLSKNNVNKAMELIFKEIKDISRHGLKESELQRAKDQLKGGLLLSLENVNSRMSRLGKSEMYLGKVLTPDEIVGRVFKVTNEDIKRVAKNMFIPDRFTMAAIGPWQDCGELNTALAKLKE
ncbi:M16 family metallopeptidase [Desulfofalx alkaliphila]|uniref:M16 family metallopeptidase n=1 Tax=Desulfofalx alkaliphila TaxID=105483 RepID=UPI0004E20BBC|nr:pitrilysin family protein [Desulfofalx alkaliphila]